MNRRTYLINHQHFTLDTAYDLVHPKHPYTIRFAVDVQKKIQQCSHFLNQKIKNNPQQAYYGINTGFGSLRNRSIDKEDLKQLQRNLLLSHACGMGEKVPTAIVRLMLLLKIQSLSYGYSGIHPDTMQRLLDFFNHEISPVVYQQGSLGASGDLAPLAHLSLPILGEGKVVYQGQEMSSADLLNQLGWKALDLHPKEGLALINGTQFMSAYGVWCVAQAQYLAKVADLIAAIALEAFNGNLAPFWHKIHEIRGQQGQKIAAQRISGFLENSTLINQEEKDVQDPYSFRCVPQVHGASLDAIDYVAQIVEREINGVTDNPNIFVEEDRIVSAGNFHGQPLALALDFLAMACAELGSISERRTFKLIGGERSLPPFLVADPGLNSGFMIPQYTAASIVSQNKQLCTPASVDSIVSSNGQEDHVSMGANAATKCYRVVQNLQHILAIELMTALQALAFRKKKYPDAASSPIIEQVFEAYREQVPFLEKDRFLFNDQQSSLSFINTILPKILAQTKT